MSNPPVDKTIYKRVLLKISGEGFCHEGGFGIEAAELEQVGPGTAREIPGRLANPQPGRSCHGGYECELRRASGIGAKEGKPDAKAGRTTAHVGGANSGLAGGADGAGHG